MTLWQAASVCAGLDLPKATSAVQSVTQITYTVRTVACCREYTSAHCVSTLYNASQFDRQLTTHGTSFSLPVSPWAELCLKNISTCGAFDLTYSVNFTEVRENIPCTYSQFTQQQSCPRLSLSCTSVCADLIV